MSPSAASGVRLSRTWHRVDVAQRCGACGAAIAPRVWSCRVVVAGTRRRLVRCATCAADDVPLGVLEAGDVPAPDWKADAAGRERE